MQRCSIVIVLLAGLAPVLSASAAWQAYEGRASEQRGGELAYLERHFIREDAGGIVERVVTYLCPGGQAFARKRVDYTRSAIAPGFELEDARSGHREGARHVEDGLELFSARPGEAAGRGVVATTDELVVDAGFDEFVRQQWDRLVAGDPVRLRFALPSRADAFRFQIGQRGSAEGELRLRLQLRGWLGWAAPNIDVAYSLEDRRLLRYEGPSNLSDPRGRPWQVRIEFPRPPASADADAVELALAEPLGDCST